MPNLSSFSSRLWPALAPRSVGLTHLRERLQAAKAESELRQAVLHPHHAHSTSPPQGSGAAGAAPPPEGVVGAGCMSDAASGGSVRSGGSLLMTPRSGGTAGLSQQEPAVVLSEAASPNGLSDVPNGMAAASGGTHSSRGQVDVDMPMSASPGPSKWQRRQQQRQQQVQQQQWEPERGREPAWVTHDWAPPPPVQPQCRRVGVVGGSSPSDGGAPSRVRPDALEVLQASRRNAESGGSAGGCVVASFPTGETSRRHFGPKWW